MAVLGRRLVGGAHQHQVLLHNSVAQLQRRVRKVSHRVRLAGGQDGHGAASPGALHLVQLRVPLRQVLQERVKTLRLRVKAARLRLEAVLAPGGQPLALEGQLRRVLARVLVKPLLHVRQPAEARHQAAGRVLPRHARVQPVPREEGTPGSKAVACRCCDAAREGTHHRWGVGTAAGSEEKTTSPRGLSFGGRGSCSMKSAASANGHLLGAAAALVPCPAASPTAADGPPGA